MYPPADGCDMSEAFSIEPFSIDNGSTEFEGFGKQSYEHLNPMMGDQFERPNINQPSTSQQQPPNVQQQPPNVQQQPPSNVQQSPNVQQPPNVQQRPPNVQQQRPPFNGGRPPKQNPIVHRDIHIVNNRPSHMNRPLPAKKYRRPVINNTYIDKSRYVRRPRKQNNDNNWLWIIIGILIFFNIVLSVMYVSKK